MEAEMLGKMKPINVFNVVFFGYWAAVSFISQDLFWPLGTDGERIFTVIFFVAAVAFALIQHNFGKRSGV